MDAQAILDGAEARIQKHRTAKATLRFVNEEGRPLADFAADVALARHEFKLGANAFRIGAIADPALQRAYEERFAALLNYATLPFYWGGYEPEPGRPQHDRLQAMADWCRHHHITAKGHPLVWHEVFPKWAEALDDADVLERLEARVRDAVNRFHGHIDIWDVVNEATVSERFDNAVGRWMKADGAAACVAHALAWANDANPDATLLYNDFNVSPAFEQLVQALLDRRAPVGTLGVQSHMHKGTWPIERVWEVCETYARFGLPLHFTEATVLSGDLKKPDDNDWHRRHDDWPTTPDGEARQLDFGRAFYTVLFSHPAVEAATWWDFSDEASWQGAPAGLVRRDMSPKPLYDWLLDAFQGKWTTAARIATDAHGLAPFDGFFGDYEVTGVLGSGLPLKGAFSLLRRGPRTIDVELS